MHMISVTIKACGVQIPFLFKTKESAEIAWHACKNAPVSLNHAAPVMVELADDYGQTGCFTPADVILTMANLDTQFDGQIERSILAARANAKGQQKAMSDPVLKTAALMNPGRNVVGFPGPGRNSGGFSA